MTRKIPTTRPARAFPTRARRTSLKGLAISLASLAALVGVTLMITLRAEPQATVITVASALDDGFNPVAVTDLFHPSDTFYVSVRIANYRSDQRIQAQWRFNGQPIRVSNLETHGASGEITAGFSASNSEAWPVGKYSVDIVYRGKILGSARFRVEP